MQPQEPASRSQTNLRDGQRRWIERLLAHARQRDARATLTSIARAAGLNANTLTRFMSHANEDGALSTRTLRAVAAAAGYPITSDVLGEQTASAIGGLREPEAEPYQPQPSDPLDPAIAAMITQYPHAAPFTLRSRALEYEGYRMGDVLIVDLTASPQAGNVVCVQIFDVQSGEARTAFRLFEPPYLIAAGPVDDARRPRLIDSDTVVIRGTVLAALRRRSTRAA